MHSLVCGLTFGNNGLSDHFSFYFIQELEQSEYERREKEQERSAHESIVEREIRWQYERDHELERQRSKVYYRSAVSPVSAPPTVGGASHDVVDSLWNHSIPDHKPPTTPATDYEPAIEEAMPFENSMSTQSLPHLTPEGKQVSYEEAISTFAHRGESMIAKELREQKEREEELRQRWHEMGVESPLEPSIPDTPYNRPDPPQSKTSHVPRPGTRDSLVYGDMIGTAPAPRRISANTKKHHPPEATNGGANGNVDLPKAKVQPWHADDEEDEEGTGEKYVPQYETPIEREIRLAREREEELRIQKRLPVVVPDQSRDVMLEVKGEIAPKRPHFLYRKGEENQAGTMKKLASSRIQHEMNREKEREMELHRSGRISTTSDQRTGESKAKYVDIISKDSVAPSPNPPRTPTTPKTPSYVRSPMSTMSSSSAPYRTMTVESKIPDRQPPQYNQSNSLPNGNVPNGNPVKHDTPVIRKPEPNVTRFGGPNRKPNQAETLIEKELREMREREEELR